MTADAPQPGTPLPWEVSGPYIREAAPTKVVVAHVLPYHRGDEKQNQAYIVYAANELPKAVADRARLLAAVREIRRWNADNAPMGNYVDLATARVLAEMEGAGG